MAFAGINYLAVLVAAVAAFAFGAVYYISMSRLWLAAIGFTKEQMSASRSPTPFIVSAVALLIMAWVLAGTIGHLGLGQVTVRNGIISGLFVWLGFVITTLAVNYAYGQRRPMLTVIDGIHWLGVLVVQGAIIGAMGI
jgi:hypothetical protein